MRDDASRHANDQPQIKKQQRRGEEQAVDQIERAANSRQHVAGILHAGAALDDRFGQIADDRRETEQQSEHDRMRQFKTDKMSRHQLETARRSRAAKTRARRKILPRFSSG